MLQAMLADRFKVVVHHESKEVPVYNLVVAKGGLKFKQAETVDADELRKRLDGGGMIGTNVRVVPSPNGTTYYGISMAILTQTLLSNMAGRSVVDKTGLTGNYDLTFPDLKRLSLPRQLRRLLRLKPTNRSSQSFRTRSDCAGVRETPDRHAGDRPRRTADRKLTRASLNSLSASRRDRSPMYPRCALEPPSSTRAAQTR